MLTAVLMLKLSLAAVPVDVPVVSPSPSAVLEAKPIPDVMVTPPPEAEEVSLGWTLLRTVVVMGVVLAAIYLTLNVGLRRLMGLRPTALGAKVVEVVERVPLDQKHAVYVIKAGNQYLLIGGGTDGGLSLITQLEAEEIERMRAENPAPKLSLSPLLQKLLARKGNPPR